MPPPFRLDWRDWKAKSRLFERKPFFAPWFRWVVLAVVALVFGLNGHSKIIEPMVIAILIEVAIHFWIFQEWKQAMQKSPVLTRFIKFNVSDEGLSTTGDIPLPWTRIERIVETKTHFFAVMTLGAAPHTIQSALIIPKRAFDSPAQCAEFGALLNRKWAQHHGDAAPIAAAK